MDFDRDWADNYYTTDLLTDKVTKGDFDYAHNEDVSLADGWWDSHSFPVEWYRATITGVYSDGDKDLGDDNLFNGVRYGFPRSLESGEANWQESKAIEVGNYPSPLLDKTKAVVKEVVDFTKSTLSKSISGFVASTSNILTLTTGSPVWTHVLVEMPENSNYISFTCQFNNPDEGYLTAYFNDNLILIGDQRFDGNNLIESGEIYVSNLLAKDNWLTFRLDSIDGGQSEISLSDVEIGTITNQADINNDLVVNFDDFASFAGQWLNIGCSEQNEWCQYCDFDQDGAVDTGDLEVISTNWLWEPVERIKGDLNFTGRVDFADYSILASQWLNDCQSPSWCYGCDFDKTGRVELSDLVEFANDWLTTY